MKGVVVAATALGGVAVGHTVGVVLARTATTGVTIATMSTTVNTTTATLRPILIKACFFCDFPLLFRASRARTTAGTVHRAPMKVTVDVAMVQRANTYVGTYC